MFTPTEEQKAIVEAARGSQKSLMIKAYAGCAKTTTLQLMAEVMPAIPSLALAFNVKIKKELESRFPKHFQVKTLNGLGHAAWAQALGGVKLELDDKKLGKIVTKVLKDARQDQDDDNWVQVRDLASKAMQLGLVPSDFPHKSLVPDTEDGWGQVADCLFDPPSQELFPLARKVVVENVKLAYYGVISFDDQIYMSAMYGGQFRKYAQVLVDEGQDLSPLNHIMVEKSLTPEGRLMVCGDPKQAIYAFRGADSSSMEKLRRLRKTEDWIDLPLATTFRCPKIIVDRQQKHAPGFRAADSAPLGAFKRWMKEGEGAQIHWLGAKHDGWTAKWLLDIAATGGHSSVAVLCRNNAPLLSLAFKLIRAGVPPVMLGRDIGKGLISLSKKILPKDTTLAADCLRLIEEWRDKEVSLARVNKAKEKVAGIQDRAECLIAVLEGVQAKDAAALRKALDSLFGRETGRVTLATGHRAKGLEWGTILHLDSWRIPSRFALEDPS